MIQSIARIALGALLLFGIVAALHKHGKQIPTYRFHAMVFLPSLILEAVLIWLAGGWG